MRRDHGQFGIILVAILVILVLALVGLFTVCTGGDDDSLGRIQLVSHHGGYCDPYYDDCGDDGNYGRDQDSANRHRGNFSPGPFDRSPIDFSNSCISLDCSGRDKGKDNRRGQPPGEEPERLHPASIACAIPVPWHCDPKPASLFPPSPDKIIKGIQTLADGGIQMGTTIARLVTDYVATVFRFIV